MPKLDLARALVCESRDFTQPWKYKFQMLYYAGGIISCLYTYCRPVWRAVDLVMTSKFYRVTHMQTATLISLPPLFNWATVPQISKFLN